MTNKFFCDKCQKEKIGDYVFQYGGKPSNLWRYATTLGIYKYFFGTMFPEAQPKEEALPDMEPPEITAFVCKDCFISEHNNTEKEFYCFVESNKYFREEIERLK